MFKRLKKELEINIEEKETWEDREDKWISTTKMCLYNKEGKIIGTFGISRDITYRKKTEEKLKIAKVDAENYARKAEEANRTKSEFLSSMRLLKQAYIYDIISAIIVTVIVVAIMIFISRISRKKKERKIKEQIKSLNP